MTDSVTHISQSSHELDRKNLKFYYSKFYEDFFRLLNNLIDEKEYKIKTNKELVEAFCDRNAYSLIGKPSIKNKEDEKSVNNQKIIKEKLKEFPKFYEELQDYPTERYSKIRRTLSANNYDFKKINQEEFYYLINEYYDFFEKVVIVLNRIVKSSEETGTFPILRSKVALKKINFAMYDFFYEEMHKFTIKVNSTLEHINKYNMLKAKRTVYLFMIVLDPYFKFTVIRDGELEKLNFKFMRDRDKCNLIHKAFISDKLGTDDKKEVNEILNSLKYDIKFIQSYISTELGEVGIAPTVKTKYEKDPTFF